MKTDRELLELAAKAAGKENMWFANNGADSCMFFHQPNRSVYGVWNPLTDDGDALRLAVRLNFVMDLMDSCAVASSYNNEFSMVKEIQEHEGKDPYAATRRAIVRAAAAIGESL